MLGRGGASAQAAGECKVPLMRATRPAMSSRPRMLHGVDWHQEAPHGMEIGRAIGESSAERGVQLQAGDERRAQRVSDQRVTTWRPFAGHHASIRAASRSTISGCRAARFCSSRGSASTS